MMATAPQSSLFPSDGWWHVVSRRDPRALALADRHYSRQTIGGVELFPPGRRLCMLTADGLALWGAVENLDPAGAIRWRVTIFRNEGPALSSILVREATERTYSYWRAHYGAVPGRLTTEVDPDRVRRKRDPGRCFLRAGWDVIGRGRGHRAGTPLVILGAPEGPASAGYASSPSPADVSSAPGAYSLLGAVCGGRAIREVG